MRLGSASAPGLTHINVSGPSMKAVRAQTSSPACVCSSCLQRCRCARASPRLHRVRSIQRGEPLAFQRKECDFVCAIDSAQHLRERQAVDDLHRLQEANVLGAQVSVALHDAPLAFRSARARRKRRAAELDMHQARRRRSRHDGHLAHARGRRPGARFAHLEPS